MTEQQPKKSLKGGMIVAQKKTTAEVCRELALPVAEERGLELWDVRYEKEGSLWYLRFFIDKEGGVDINDCEGFSRAIDPILDEADPISSHYYLEVSSPGVERDLLKPHHFERYMGRIIKVRLIRALDGIKEFTGKLASYEDDVITIIPEGKEPVSLPRNTTAYVRLQDDFKFGGN